MRNRRGLLWRIVLASGLLMMIGCPKEPAKVNVALLAAPDINPDPSGKPLSVVVRIYQLKDKGRLEAADYVSIWKSDKTTLSEDFLDVQERMIEPDTEQTLDIKAHPMAAYVGVVALFQNHTGDTWRKVVPVTGKNQKIKLRLRQQNVEIISEKD